MKKREKKRRLLEERMKENEAKHEDTILGGEVDHHDYIEDISDAEVTEIDTSPTQFKTKSEDIRTVDLSQLGDLFSEYQSSSSSSQVFAKKSIPTTTAIAAAPPPQQQLQTLQQQQHPHQQQ